MGWLKIDDKMPRNPKILAGDLDACWFYVCALTHAAEQLTDGFIARSAVPLVAPHITDPCSVAERCADLDLFRRVEGGYQVPDYLDFNPSRADVLEKRDKDRARQTKHRTSRDASRRDSHETSGVTPRVPSRPVPDASISSSTDGFNKAHDSPTTREAAHAATVEDVATAVARHRMQSQSTKVRNPNAWLKRTLGAMRTDEGGAWWANVVRLCDEYPAAPVSMLAAAADGEMSPHLAHYRREAS